MRICDRCKTGTTRTVLLDKRSGSEYDLCQPYTEDFNEFLSPSIPKEPMKEKPVGRGRPKTK